MSGITFSVHLQSGPHFRNPIMTSSHSVEALHEHVSGAVLSDVGERDHVSRDATIRQFKRQNLRLHFFLNSAEGLGVVRDDSYHNSYRDQDGFGGPRYKNPKWRDISAESAACRLYSVITARTEGQMD